MAKQFGCREKVIAAALSLGILWATFYVGGIWGSVQRDVSTKKRITPRLANLVYRAAKEDRLDSIERDRLGSAEVAASLKEAETSHGPIQSWEVIGAYPTPIGLPVFVVLEVQRNDKSYEVLTIHSGHFFSDHMIKDRAGLKNLGLPEPP